MGGWVGRKGTEDVSVVGYKGRVQLYGTKVGYSGSVGGSVGW